MRHGIWHVRARAGRRGSHRPGPLMRRDRIRPRRLPARRHPGRDSGVVRRGPPAADANFIIALCSKTALPPAQSFIYVPQTANLLHERDQHIRLLDAELHTTQAWLRQTQHDRDRLLDQHRELLESYETQNRWAKSLELDLTAARQRIDQLHRGLASEQQSAVETARAYETKSAHLTAERST